MELRNVCRTCLLPGESMLSIFDLVQVPIMEPNKIPILDLLKLFTEISVSSNDDRPDNVCSNCLDKVHRSYTFKIKYEKSESILKQLNDERKNVIELIDGRKEYERVIEQIKLEKTEDYGVPEMFEHSITNKEAYLVQEIKEEPEIEIVDVDVDDKVLYDTDFDEECLKARNGETLKSLTQTAHANDLTNKKKFNCATCSKLYVKKSELSEHMLTHTGERPFNCDICPKKYRHRRALKSHIQSVHADSAKFECSSCFKLFERKYSLIQHLKIHTREKRFHCAVCAQKFRFKTHLESHLETAHSDETEDIRKFKCATCLKLFGRESTLNHHMRTHTGETPFKCEVCPQKFRCRQILKRHIEIVHGDRAKTFKCSICSKLFEIKRYLKQHMKIHTVKSTVKLFQCENCPRKYRSSFRLKNHMRVHNEVATVKRKFKCEICWKLFARKTTLNDHMRIHTGEKPLQCEFCQNSFLGKNNFKRHMESTHFKSIILVDQRRAKTVGNCTS